MIKCFIKLPKIGNKFFFGFSDVINNIREDTGQLEERIKSVPDNRILLESDWNHCEPHTQSMQEIIKIVGRAKQWTSKQTIKITTANAIEFFGLDQKPPS